MIGNPEQLLVAAIRSVRIIKRGVGLRRWDLRIRIIMMILQLSLTRKLKLVREKATLLVHYMTF